MMGWLVGLSRRSCSYNFHQLSHVVVLNRGPAVGDHARFRLADCNVHELFQCVAAATTGLLLLESLTSEPACLLNDLVDLLQRLHELLVIVASYLVTRNEITVDIVELRVPLSH